MGTTHPEPEPKPVDVRWQCPRGHFVADSSITCTDFRDELNTYYGVRTEWHYTCKGCGCEYVDDVGPRIAVVRDSDEPPPEEMRCWRTTPEGRQWQANLQEAINRRAQ